MEPTSDVAGSSSGGGSSSRWNPTKEQLSMLESLYGQGIRTPSAEQIQSITKRLQVYGHIEGKNVFYWFQNHKARQRQKQKLDQMTTANNNNNNNVVVNNGNAAAYFNRFYYPSPPLSPTVAVVPARAQSFFPAAPHNVSYGPYYIAHPEYGLNPHCPKMVLPNQILSNSETPGQIRHDFHRDVAKFGAQNVANAGVNVAYPSNAFTERSGQVTLDLFPVHPTGILEGRECHRSPTTGSSTENSLEAGSDQDRPSGVGFDMFSKVRN